MLTLKFVTYGFEISLGKLNDKEEIEIENDSSKQQSKYLLIYTLEGEYKFKKFFELSKDRYYVPSQTGEFKGFSGMKNLGGIANNCSLFNISSCFDIVDDKYTPDNTKSTELQHLYWIVRKELFEEDINNSLDDYYKPFSEQGKELLAKVINIQSMFIEAFGSDYHNDDRFDDDIDSTLSTKYSPFLKHIYVKLKDGTIGILWSDNTEDNTIHVIIERDLETSRGGYDPEFISCYQFIRSAIAIESDDLSEVKKECEFDFNPIEIKSLNGGYHKETIKTL